MNATRAWRGGWRATVTAVVTGVVLAVSVSGPAVAEVTEFADVPPGAAFYDDIQWLAAEGITHGAVGPGGTVIFGPGDPITREAMAAFIYRFRGEPAFSPPAESPFTDLEPGGAFFHEITWLEDQGIAPGQGDVGGEETFRPSDLVTREVMAVWLYRALAAPGFTPPETSPFVDIDTDHPAYQEIAWMAETRLSTGVPVGDGTFRFEPEDPITREAVAAFLHRASALPPPDTTPPAVPLGVEAVPGDGAAAVSWAPVADADLADYTVFRGPSSAGPWTEVPGGPVTATTVTVGGLTNGTTYWFVVIATDTSGNSSAPSTAVSAVPFKPGGPYDLELDGKVDLPAVEKTTGVLWLYRSDGLGGWRVPAQVGGGWAGVDVLEPAGDLDGDGKPDLLVREAATGLLWLHPGDGKGGVLTPRQVGWGWSVMSAIVAPGDLDGDGKPDLLAREAATGLLWLYPGDGEGGWLTPTQVGSGWATMSAIVAPGDVDGDGNPDVLARDSVTGALVLYPGDGEGGWLTPRQVGWGWSAMSAIVGPGDFDGDGKRDLLAREAATGVLYLYPGDGAGGWLERRLLGPGWAGYLLPGFVAAPTA